MTMKIKVMLGLDPLNDDTTPSFYHSTASKISNTIETAPSGSPKPFAQSLAIPHDFNTVTATLRTADST